MHVVVVCAGTHSDVRATRRVSRIPPRTAPTCVRDGGRAVVVLCLAVPVVVRARSQGLSDARGKDRRRVAESLAHPEKGRVVVSRGDGQVAERVEYKHSDRLLSRALERASRKRGFAVPMLIARAQAARRVMLAKSGGGGSGR